LHKIQSANSIPILEAFTISRLPSPNCEVAVSGWHAAVRYRTSQGVMELG
jgi:hypothetical protein